MDLGKLNLIHKKTGLTYNTLFNVGRRLIQEDLDGLELHLELGVEDYLGNLLYSDSQIEAIYWYGEDVVEGELDVRYARLAFRFWNDELSHMVDFEDLIRWKIV